MIPSENLVLKKIRETSDFEKVFNRFFHMISNRDPMGIYEIGILIMGIIFGIGIGFMISEYWKNKTS